MLFAKSAADNIGIDQRQAGVGQRQGVDRAAILILVVVEIVDAVQVGDEDR